MPDSAAQDALSASLKARLPFDLPSLGFSDARHKLRARDAGTRSPPSRFPAAGSQSPVQITSALACERRTGKRTTLEEAAVEIHVHNITDAKASLGVHNCHKSEGTNLNRFLAVAYIFSTRSAAGAIAMPSLQSSVASHQSQAAPAWPDGIRRRAGNPRVQLSQMRKQCARVDVVRQARGARKQANKRTQASFK